MKKIITILSIALNFGFQFNHAYAQTNNDAVHIKTIDKTDKYVKINQKNGTLFIEPITDNIINVKFKNNENLKDNYTPELLAIKNTSTWELQEDKDNYFIITKKLKVKIGKTDGVIIFLDLKDEVILGESGENARKLEKGIKQSFYISHTDAIYGFGQHQNGRLNSRGLSIKLQQANSDVGVPVIVSSKGYGIIWHNPSITNIDVGIPQASSSLDINSEDGEIINYNFIYGPEIDDIIKGYRLLTGIAPMMPRWSWGLWQSKERYKTQEELVSVAKKHRELKIPFDVIVQDWQYWSKDQWGSHEFDKARFPNPAGMVKELHDNNIHTIISVWPRFDLGTKNAQELDSIGALYPKTYNNVYPQGVGRWYDAYSDNGRKKYWEQISKNLGTLGYDGFWLDGSEAELGGNWGEMRDVNTAAGRGSAVLNAYPLLHTTAVHDGMKQDISQKRAFILTRSAYLGQQRNASITWSGDTVGTWDVFQRQIPAALNFSIGGIPYWSADIGGFFGGDPKEKGYAELFTRWYQFAVFNPMFRIHGTGAGKEIWQFNADTQKILIDYTKLRYRLLPYIYSMSWEVTNNSGTMMRPLAMDFRKDRTALNVTDQYMFGKEILVSPVIQANTKQRSVYLPKDNNWYNFYDGKLFKGEQVISAKADINTIPLFIKSGSILPLGPVKQYADEKSIEPIEIRIYPGKNAEYSLYDDSGDGYEYEKGQYSIIKFVWDENLKQLTLKDRIGSFKDMPKTQDFKIICGSSLDTKTTNIKYLGKETNLKLSNCKASNLN